jgi:hypothetical protein
MNTLEDAWNWYIATRKNLERMQRIGNKYWAEVVWDTAAIGRDDEFRTLEKKDIEAETTVGLAPMDDLAVVVLFSVFEALVRGYVVDRIAPEAERLTDPILKFAAAEAIRGVEEGSFFQRVLEPLKQHARVSVDLITQVNQVRDYRNWVAHGRRGSPKNNVDPNSAYDRLNQFLEVLGLAVEPEESESEKPALEPD